MPMNELVLSLHSKLISTLRLSSVAGNGLAERMRSTSFALLGLTAAAGLALVAIFAQPGFSLISPAPLPAEPSIGESIANAKRLPLDHGSVAIVSARPAAAPQGDGGSSAVEARSGRASSHSKGPVQDQPAPAETAAPVPASAPTSSGGKSTGGKEHETGGASSPAPAAAPQQPASSPSAPTSSPPPSNPKPEAIASAPKPEPAPAPGNSSSAAAAEHASERGIEASAGSGPPTAPTTASSVVPESSSSPGNGNGLAKGHYR